MKLYLLKWGDAVEPGTAWYFSKESAVNHFHACTEMGTSYRNSLTATLIELDVPSTETKIRYIPAQKRFLKPTVPSEVIEVTPPTN